MKKNLIYTIAFVSALALLAGCELAGLELQKKYDYDYNAGIISNELNMTVLEFLNSRTDEFSLMLEGIEYAEMEDMYNEPNCTYMALTNRALNSTTDTDLSYFYTHRLVNPQFDPNDPSKGDSTLMALSLTQYPKEQVREFLLYHIAKGEWTWSNLPPVPTWYDTFASSDTAKVNLYLMKNNRSPTIGFNDFVSHYKLAVRARSTNLKASSGSYVHALDSWLEYPTREALKLD